MNSESSLRTETDKISSLEMENNILETAVVSRANPERKVYNATKMRIANQIPDEILNDEKLAAAMSSLPPNYNFEIHKMVWRVRQAGAKRVALQMPEGLQRYALNIADILEEFCQAEAVIMADVTYGACCVDDYTAKALGADFLIHYGHSCLIPVDQTSGIKMLYVFVDIKFDYQHFLETVKFNFEKDVRMAFISTIQFVSSLQSAVSELKSEGYIVNIPKASPLSPGEVLGCTSPRIDADVLIYLGDGRFHLESAMIANPQLKAYQYDPYSKKFTVETYAYEEMKRIRKAAIETATKANTFGIVVSTLGRQGSPKVVTDIKEKLKRHKKEFITVYMNEISPDKLVKIKNVDAWIQIACPRLSIDWGLAFEKPLLTPYEATVALNEIEWKEDYPMDFYAYDSLGPWTPNFKPKSENKKKSTCCRTDGKTCS